MGADPISAGLLGLSIASTVAGGVSQGQQAAAQARAANRQADAAQAEAARQAETIRRQTAQERQRAGADLRRQLAAARVDAVGAGIDAGSGSALEVLSSAAAQGALDLAHIDYAGGLRAAQALRRGQQAAYGYSASASAARARRGDALLHTGLGLGGTVLGLGSRGW